MQPTPLLGLNCQAPHWRSALTPQTCSFICSALHWWVKRRLPCRDSGISKKPSPCLRGTSRGPQLAILEMLALANTHTTALRVQNANAVLRKGWSPQCSSDMPTTRALSSTSPELNQGHRLLQADREQQEMNTMQDHCSPGAAASALTSCPITVSQDCHLLGIPGRRKL